MRKFLFLMAAFLSASVSYAQVATAATYDPLKLNAFQVVIQKSLYYPGIWGIVSSNDPNLVLPLNPSLNVVDKATAQKLIALNAPNGVPYTCTLKLDRSLGIKNASDDTIYLNVYGMVGKCTP